MSERLLKPRPMLAVETCVTCGRAHAEGRGFRRCSVCARAFCWEGEPRGANLLGTERRACGSRRDASSESDEQRRVEYRCRAHVTRSWALLGADWEVARPLVWYVALALGFSLTFWGAVFYAVTAWLRERGLG